MKLRYFIADPSGQIQRASQPAMEGLWEGRISGTKVGGGKSELRLVSVLCDDQLQPNTVYLLRVPLTNGMFTPESQLTLQIFTMRDCVTEREMLDHHGGGWPRDLMRQLAVALDVPLARLNVPVRVGGPLFVAAAMGVRPHQTLQYLQ
jgi:hypothetical protein